MKEWKENLICISIIALIVAFFGFLIFSMIKGSEKHTTCELDLQEISDGIYAVRQENTSRAPAYNYTIITFCADNGNVYTVRGSCQITFTDENPHVVWDEYNIINSDRVHLYIPQGTLKINPATSSE